MPTPARRLTAALALTLVLPTVTAGAAFADGDDPTVPTPPAPLALRERAPAAAPKPSPATLTLAQYRAQRLRWSASACSAAMRAVAAEVSEGRTRVVPVCAAIKAPLDWSNLSKGSITVQVSRVARTPAKGDRRPTRALFVNPGGPGVSTDQIVPVLAAVKPTLRRTHDIVGVDPRGTGLSTPVPCTAPDDHVADYRDTSTRTRAKVQAAIKSAVAACVKRHGRVLPHITTANTTHDMDLARHLMRQRTIDWYGVSGGTWLGAWYAQLHRAHVGRFVLDSNTDFTTTWEGSFAGMPKGMQRRFSNQFLPWVARQHKEYGLGSTRSAANAAYERIRAAARRGRITNVTPNTLDAYTVVNMYDDMAFPLLADELSRVDALVRKGRRATFNLPEGFTDAETPSSAIGSRMALLCNDTAGSRNPAEYEARTLRDGRAYPLWGYGALQVMGPCAYWPYRTAPAPAITGVGVPTMLMVQNEMDPATPIEGARRAHARNRATRMVTVDNAGGHGAYFSSRANPCVDKVVHRFLSTGALPWRDTKCNALPLPRERRVLEYVVR